MKQGKKVMLPIAGNIQHGEQLFENNKKRVVDYGYFIAKVKNDNLKYLENRFNEKFNKQKAITIRIIDDDPFSIKMIRYNQGGTACYCMLENEIARQKVSNQWKDVKCDGNCQYREIAEGQSKPACNREGILKFMLPEINTDRIWLMKITGQTAIDNLDRYFNMQKIIGNSLIGDYKIFLYKKEQTSKGKKFNNYILDIARESEIMFKNSIEANQLNTNELSTESVEKVENNENKVEETELKTQNNVKNNKKNAKDTKNAEKNITRKSTKEKKQGTSKQEDVESKEHKTETSQVQERSQIDNEFANYYVLVETKKQKALKDGKPTEYVVATFNNLQDETTNVFIPPNLADELLECDIGTTVILDLQTVGNKTFTKSIQYYNKLKKNIAA